MFPLCGPHVGNVLIPKSVLKSGKNMNKAPVLNLIRAVILKPNHSSYFKYCRLFCSKEVTSLEETTNSVDASTTLSIAEATDATPDASQRVAVKGWVLRVRPQKDYTFVHISDNLTAKKLQLVVPDDVMERSEKRIQFGSSLYAVGVIQDSPGKNQSVELKCDNFIVIGDCPPNEYPISYKNYSPVVLRQNLHLRPRVSTAAAVIRLRSSLKQFIHQVMRENNYIEITTPIITSNDCEGGGQVFSVKSPFCSSEGKYFDTDVHLTVSGQLHLEACASKVYTLSPAFRAENGVSRRHISEFTMFEVEESYISSLSDLMDNVELLCKSFVNHLTNDCAEDLKLLISGTKRNNYMMTNSKYIRMTYDEAVDLINKVQTVEALKHGNDISAYHENVLLEYFDNIPVFITHYPAHLKPFYMKREGNKALCFDLIFPVCGEVCGGSLREENYEKMKEQMSNMQSLDNFQWYLDLRKFGSVPHGGFGIGFDRLIQSVTGVLNIKDIVTFPRWSHHCLL